MQAGVVGTGREGPGGTCAVVTAPGSAVHPAPSPQTCVCPWLVLLGGGSPSGRGAKGCALLHKDTLGPVCWNLFD